MSYSCHPIASICLEDPRDVLAFYVGMAHELCDRPAEAELHDVVDPAAIPPSPGVFGIPSERTLASLLGCLDVGPLLHDWMMPSRLIQRHDCGHLYSFQTEFVEGQKDGRPV
jgi:hypothetical protein